MQYEEAAVGLAEALSAVTQVFGPVMVLPQRSAPSTPEDAGSRIAAA